MGRTEFYNCRLGRVVEVEKRACAYEPMSRVCKLAMTQLSVIAYLNTYGHRTAAKPVTTSPSLVWTPAAEARGLPRHKTQDCLQANVDVMSRRR